MTARTRKIVKDMTETHDNAVAILATEVLPAQADRPASLTRIVSTPQAVGATIRRITTLTVDAGYHANRNASAYEKATVETMRLRRMFPATDERLALLGEDTPDLIGATPAYKAALAKINEVAKDELIERLVAEGLSRKIAETEAIAQNEVVRKSVSRRIGILVDKDMQKLPNGAAVMLAHGFSYNGERGKGQILSPGMKLVEGTLEIAAPPTVEEQAGLTPANQDGKSEARAKDIKTMVSSVETHLTTKDHLGLLVDARSFIGTAAGLLPGEDIALAARAVVELQRSVNTLIKAWGFTPAQLKAAATAQASIPAPKVDTPSETERADAFAAQLEAEKLAG